MQYNSTTILQFICAQDVVLGVLEHDICAYGLNFVFGEEGGRRALISLFRLGEHGRAREEMLKERALKEAVHEIGHILGLPHCPDRK